MKRLKDSIATKYAQLETAVESYKGSLKVQIETSKQMLAKAQVMTDSKTAESVIDKQKRSEYFTAKNKYESQLLLLSSIKEHSMKSTTDEGVPRKPVQLISSDQAIQKPDVAGLLPLEIALPDDGEEFQFSGHHAPGAMTFSARSLHQESRAAWLWIAAGIVAAGVLARRRPVFHGLLVGLLLSLVPWIVQAGMGVCHRLLIGWIIGCGLILCFRILSKRRGSETAPRTQVTAAGAALVSVLLLTNTQANAQEQAAADDSPSVIVPYDPAKPLAEQTPHQIYVDYERFQQLWQDAREHRLAANEPAAPALAGKSAAVISALYDGNLAGGMLKIDAMLTVHTSGQWAVLALQEKDKTARFAGASIASLTVDGKAAVIHDGALLIEKAGRHILRAALHAPLTGDWRSFEAQLPRAPAAIVSLTHTDASLRLKLNGGLPVEVSEKREGGYQWRGTAALGNAGLLRLERLPGVILAAGSEKPPLGAVRARLFVTPAIERLDSRIDFEFPGAERREFSFSFDASLTPIQIDIPNLESWSLREANGRRALDFRLSVPARERLTAGFLAERAAAAKAGDERSAPAIVPATNRQEYTLELLSSDDLEVIPKLRSGWTRSELKGMGEAAGTGFRSAGAFRLAGGWTPLTWTAPARPMHRTARAEYAWKIAGGMLETTVTITLRAAEHEDLSALTIPLPPNAALQTLDGDRLKDWWRAGDTVELRFAGATAETTTVWLDFTQPLTDGHMKNGLPLPCLTLQGYDEVTGRGVLATSPEIDARLRLDDKPFSAREVEAEQARGDYLFLPPLLVRRGITFETPVFHVTALLEPVAPRFAIRWVLGAAVEDAWTDTQFRVDVEVRQGALPDLRFLMPAGTPEARVSGDKVRETVRTNLPGGRAEYRVAFQSSLTDSTALTIAVEIPHTNSIALPDVDFPDAALSERFLFMQNFSGGEIVPDMAASIGVEPLSRDTMQELHFTVQGFSNPLSWRLKPGWRLAAAHRALEATSGPQAVVLFAELTTMLRAEGPEWLRAVYHLQNRALQFLPLRLPENLELVSALVAGVAVRADTGTLSDNKPGLLIPLIQTRPGDLAMDVEIVCRARRTSAGANGKLARKLDDPDIPGVSVQRTLWNVWTPPGWDLDDVEGNMERVGEGSSLMERLEVDFEELDLLSSVYSSRDRASVINALTHADKLVERMEMAVNEKEAPQSVSLYSYESERGDGAELARAREKLDAAKKLQSEIKAKKEADDQQGSLQPASAGLSNVWQWDYYSSYLQSRSKERGSAKAREQSIIAENPVLNGGLCSSNPVIVSKNASGKKPGESVRAAPPALPASRRYSAQIAALEEQSESVDAIPAARSLQPGAFDMKPELRAGREEAQSAFNDVRGVRRSPSSPAVEAAAPPKTPLLPKIASDPATTLQNAPDPNARELRATAPAPPLLKPAGRVSIPITFSAGGTVHRFRKVNDRAALTMTIKPLARSTSSRWIAGIVLAAGVGALWVTDRLTHRKGHIVGKA